jgi:phage terminase large subunit GpA-like protein
MLLDGEWRPVRWVSEDHMWVSDSYPDYTVRKVAFQLSSLYSPWLTWGDMAEKFLEAQVHPMKLMNFVNSWLGEPFLAEGARFRSDVVMGLKGGYEKGTLPDGVLGLTCGIDKQKNTFYYVVRGWGAKLNSWLIDYKEVESWEAIDELLNTKYKDKYGREMMIGMAFIDSGDGTSNTDVYNFCALRLDRTRPVKGSSSPLTSIFKHSTINKGEYDGFLRLYLIDTGKCKDFIASRLLKKPSDTGAWLVPEDVDREYADQICSEQKTIKRNKQGKLVETWATIGSHTDNHYLDCEVYAYAAAEANNVQLWGMQPQQQTLANHRRVISRGIS